MKSIKSFYYFNTFLFAISFLLSNIIQAQVPIKAFPDDDAVSGKMINVTRGNSTLGDTSSEVLNISIRIPVTEANASIDIFDGNTTSDLTSTLQGFWDSHSPQSLPADEVIFELYNDPNGIGNTNPADLIASKFGGTMVDNDWEMFVNMPNDPGAHQNNDPANDYIYHIVARWNTELVPNITNPFKIRANGLPFLLAGSTIGFQGYKSREGLGDTVFPVPLFYDGAFNFAAELRGAINCYIDIYDGDLDRADDTDDPNTDNLGITKANDADPSNDFYPFPVSPVAVDETINAGNPLDDFEHPDPDLQNFIRISPSVLYQISGPTGLVSPSSYSAVNSNPSGDKEYELFRIASSAVGCPDPGTQGAPNPNYDPPAIDLNGSPVDGAEYDPPMAAPDVVVPGLAEGFHILSVVGLDPLNNAFINVSADIVPVESLADYGDAPDSYATDLFNGGEGVGPSHLIADELLIGANVDQELDGLPGVNADGDDGFGFDDEDGVTFTTPLTTDLAGQLYTVDVTVINGIEDGSSNPVDANLFGWIDFNGNGTFEASEGSTSVVASTGMAQVVGLQFLVPANVQAGDTYARFRITGDSNINTATPGGPAENGEVEDYKLTIDSGCSLTVDKTCLIQEPPTGPFDCSDAKPIDVLGMIWNNTNDVRIKAWKGNVGSTLLADIDNISFGDEVIVSGFAGSPNDVYWEIFIAGTDSKIGESKFHLSCSDDDMDGPEDCGTVLGDGKDNNSDFVNAWILELLSGNGETLDCTADTPAGNGGLESCEFEAGPVPSCETGKPDNLTWQYTGGGCAASDNNQKPGDVTCLGSIDGSMPVVILDEKGNIFYINPGDEFTTTRDASKEFTLVNNTGQEFLEIHTSCSQPLQAGDVYGSLTLVALDGQRAGQGVDYFYEVANNGSPLSDVVLIDNLLGQVGSITYLSTGESAIFTASSMITETTTNTVTVTGDAGPSAQCEATDSTTVTMTPCSLDSQGLVFSGHEIKWKLTNTNDFKTTISRITISWPSENGDLKEIKRGADTIHKGDFSPTVAVIESGWEGSAGKREIKAGDTKELKFKFDNDVSLDGEYTITVEFSSGCVVTETYTPPVSGGDFACEKPIDSLTMIWDGDVDVIVDAWKGSVGSTLLVSNAPVSVGSELTVSGYTGSPNDVYWEIFDANTGEKIGESKFHLSCSDDDMDGPEDCGKAAGDGKGTNSSLINDWILEGMVDAIEELNCTP